MRLPGTKPRRAEHLDGPRRRARAAPLAAVVVFVFGSTLFGGSGLSTLPLLAPLLEAGSPPGAPSRELGMAAGALPRPWVAEPSRPTSTDQPPTERPLNAVAAEVAPPAPATPLVEAGSDMIWDEFLVHFPPRIEGRLRVLVVLHGMEGNGPAFQAPLRAQADAAGWVIVAPTFDSGDWQDPAQLVREGKRFLPRLKEFVGELPARTGLAYDTRISVYGASRGGQLAHRFAYVYPQYTRAVAVFAPGSYTLPLESIELDGRVVPLPYPYGTADLHQLFGQALDRRALQRVAFWVGIGDADREPTDVPRQWDPYLGDNRLSRARAFAEQIAATGAPVDLAVFPGLGHALSDEMQQRALEFLAGHQ